MGLPRLTLGCPFGAKTKTSQLPKAAAAARGNASKRPRDVSRLKRSPALTLLEFVHFIDAPDKSRSSVGCSPRFSGDNASAWAKAHATRTFVGRVFIASVPRQTELAFLSVHLALPSVRKLNAGFSHGCDNEVPNFKTDAAS